MRTKIQTYLEYCTKLWYKVRVQSSVLWESTSSRAVEAAIPSRGAGLLERGDFGLERALLALGGVELCLHARDLHLPHTAVGAGDAVRSHKSRSTGGGTW